MKRGMSFWLALFMGLLFMSCGGPSESEAGTLAAGKRANIGMLYAGQLGDNAYNDACYLGGEKAAKDFSLTVTHLSSSNPKEWENNFLNACTAGFDLVICTSSNFQSYLEKYASTYPDLHFVLIDSKLEGDNILSVSFAQNESAFLAGAVAAKLTGLTTVPGINPEKTIGFIGGVDIPLLTDYLHAYEQGAKHVDKNVKVLQSFTGTWNDPLKGKALAQAQYKSGADVILAVASGTSPGVLEAAQEAGQYAIGADVNQDHYREGAVFTSMVKRVDTACYTVIKNYSSGQLEPSGNLHLGVADGGVSLTDFSVINKALGERFPREILDLSNELSKQIAKGEIAVE